VCFDSTNAFDGHPCALTEALFQHLPHLSVAGKCASCGEAPASHVRGCLWTTSDFINAAGCPLRLDMFVEYQHLLHAPGHPRVGMCTTCGKPPGHAWHTPAASSPPTLVHGADHPQAGLCMLCGLAPEQHPAVAPSLPLKTIGGGKNATTPARQSPDDLPEAPPVSLISPEASASWFSRLGWFWLSDFIELGSQRPLQMSDVYDLVTEKQAKPCAEQFEFHWQQECAAHPDSPSLVNVISYAKYLLYFRLFIIFRISFFFLLTIYVWLFPAQPTVDAFGLPPL
jgi:hypothetical protein